MNVYAYIAAQEAYENWVSSNPNASTNTKKEAYDIAQSNAFEDWIYANPKGSLEQYMTLLRRQQTYHNSPQYQIDALEDQIISQEETIEYLQHEIKDMKEELSYLESENDDLSYYNNVWIVTSFIFLILTIVLSVVLYKRTNVIQNLTIKLKKQFYDMLRLLNIHNT